MALKRRAIAVNLVHDPLHWRLWHHVDDINQGIRFGHPDAFCGALRESVEFRYLIVEQRIDGKPSDRPWRAGRPATRRLISIGGHEFRNKSGGAVGIGKADLAAVAGVVSVTVAALPVSRVPVAGVTVPRRRLRGLVAVRGAVLGPVPRPGAIVGGIVGGRVVAVAVAVAVPAARSYEVACSVIGWNVGWKEGAGYPPPLLPSAPAPAPAGDRGGYRSHPNPGDLRPTHRHVAVCRSYPLRSQYRACPTCCHCRSSRAL